MKIEKDMVAGGHRMYVGMSSDATTWVLNDLSIILD